MPTVTRRIFTPLFATLIFLAAIGRAWGLWARGLLEHDEGHALLNANTWWHVIRWLLSGGLWSNDPANSIHTLKQTLHQQGGTLYSAGKLGYSLLLATTGQLNTVSTELALLMAWLGGLAVAGLAATVTWQYSRNLPAALVVAFGCLTSPLQIDVSREASGTIWAVAFALAALILIQQAQSAKTPLRNWTMQLLGGALLAFGFLCHFNLAPFTIAVFAASALFALHQNQTRNAPFFTRLKNPLLAIAPAMIGALGGLAFAEIITRIADRVLAQSYPDFLPLSGELQLLFFRDQAPMLDGVLYGDGAIGWSPEAWAIYGRALWNEGPAWITLTLIATTFAIIGLTRQNPPRNHITPIATLIGPPLALLIIPALFWAAYIYRVERTLTMCMAASWILIGVTGAAWHNQNHSARTPRKHTALLTIFTLFLIAQTLNAIVAWKHDIRQISPVPHIVERTFDSPKITDKLITAGSFDVGFAPLWKWAIVEETRRRNRPPSRPHPRTDFSRFDGSQIVFIDTSSWRRPNQEFLITRQQVATGEILVKTHTPDATFMSVLLSH